MKDLIVKEMNLTGKLMFSRSEVIDMLERYGERPKIVDSNGISADKDTFLITYNGKNFPLPRKVFLITHYLIDNKNKVVRRNDLLREIWGTDVIVEDRTIDVHIRKIREALPTAPITTLKGVGYMWRD